MLLAIDVGNTQTVVGLYNGAELADHWRIGTVAEAAWPIVFLLTDAASFITGQTLVVDGGRLAAG